jgi:hypothetical protein
MAATLSHPLVGLRALPENWRQLVWCSDWADPPDLVPGHAPTRFGGAYSLSRQKLDGNRKDTDEYFSGLILALIYYTPTLLWRWAIKSTAWFYLPLLWVGRGWQDLRGAALGQWGTAYAATWLNRTGLAIAALCLAGSAFAIFLPLEFLRLSARLEAAGAPMSPLGYLMVLDWSALRDQPWQWFYGPSWLLTLALFLMLDHHTKHIDRGADATALEPAFRFWMWVANLRTALTNLGLLVALVWFLHAVDACSNVKAFFAVLTGA